MRRFLLTLLLAAPTLHAAGLDADRQLATSLLAISQSRMPEALTAVDQLTRQHPNFRLAHLVKGDLLLARAQPLLTLGNTGGARNADIDQLRDEARQRVRALTDSLPSDKVPAYLLNLDEGYRHALVVDASRSRLYVYANRAGLPIRVADFYVTIGKAGAGKQKEGDNRTPIGIYTISSFKPPRELTDFYGSGAFTLSYPNEWDTRQGRNGHGIWIHGSPSNTYSRAPRASEGCVVLANDDLTRLGQYVQTGKTPVIIAEQIEWVAYEALDARRNDLAAAVDQWRQDWESRDTERLLGHYSKSFRTESQNLQAFGASKQKVNAAKSWIKIGLNNLSLMLYPERPDFALVSFVQDYQSNNLSDRTPKRQFWSRENGRWKIIHETSL
ncbi:MAG: L,D-transpeptidase family protein [Thiobacillus sp.]|nr:L,D-transpeptidase family protein [Thiobacillus sp.]